MNDELVKNLEALIDETISEIEDLKKSRMSAAEVDMGKMESGMAGHPSNGSMDKADKDREKEEGRQPQEEGDIEEEHTKKAEGKNSEADPGTRGVTPPSEASVPGKSNLHQEAKKAEDDDDDDDDDDKDKKMGKAEGKNSEADPGTRGVTAPAEASVPGKSNLHQEAAKAEQPAEGYEIKKSLEESETLMKSYIDEKVGGLESKLEGIADLVKQLADQPVERKSVSAGTVPLQKSAGTDVEQLSKSNVLDKLFELKKSDPRSVDTADIISVETGMGLQAIVDKYKLQ